MSGGNSRAIDQERVGVLGPPPHGPGRLRTRSRSPMRIQSEEETVGFQALPTCPPHTLSRESSFAQKEAWEPVGPLGAESWWPSDPSRQRPSYGDNDDNSSCSSPNPGILRSSSGLPLLSHRDTVSSASSVRPSPVSKTSGLRHENLAMDEDQTVKSDRTNESYPTPRTFAHFPKSVTGSSTAVASNSSIELQELPNKRHSRPICTNCSTCTDHDHVQFDNTCAHRPHVHHLSRNKLPKALWQQHRGDELESDLIEAAMTDKDIYDFLRDYLQLKERPSGRLFESLVWVKTFAPPVLASVPVSENQTINNKASQPRQVLKGQSPSQETENVYDSMFPPTKNFSHNAHVLRSLLRMNDCNCFFQICVLATHSDHTEETFSFMQKIKASTKAHISRLYRAPRRAIIHTIAQEWALEEDDVDRLVVVNRPERISIRLPSAGPLPPPLDLNALYGTSFTLRWQAKAPRYTKDLDVYVWQPFRHAPPERCVQFHLLPARDCNTRRMILLVDDSEQLRRFQESREQNCINGHKSQFLVEDEILTSIFIIFNHMVNDSTRFLEEVVEQCSMLLYEGRVRPSGSKVQFLAHLNDCLNKAVKDISHSLVCLSEVQLFLEEGKHTMSAWENRGSYMKRAHGFKADLEFLQREFSSVGQHVNGFDGLRTMINEHINLAQYRRTMIITVLLALYVPLSFMTSFLGMNVTSESDKRGKQREGKIWQLNTFFLVSVPLAFGSIVVPLIVGATVRYIVQYAAKYHAYWRITYMVLLVLYVLSCYILLPILILDDDTIGHIILIVVTDLIMIVFGAWQIYWAFRYKARRVAWSLCLFGLVVASVLEIFPISFYLNSSIPRVFGLLQWLLLLLVWTWPDLRRAIARRKHRSQKKSQ